MFRVVKQCHSLFWTIVQLRDREVLIRQQLWKESAENKDNPTSSALSNSDGDCTNRAFINCILDATGIEVSTGPNLCYVVFIHFEYLGAGLGAQTAANAKILIYFWRCHNTSSFVFEVCFLRSIANGTQSANPILGYDVR